MKQSKLFTVLALAFSLAVTACGGGTKQCEKHTWGKAETIKQATCTEEGQTQRTCTVCGAKEEPKTVKALGHDMKDQENGQILDPECETPGTMKTKCSRCGLEGTRDIAPLGHDLPDETDLTAWSTKTPAKCEEEGVKEAKCSRCDKMVERPIEPLGHLYAQDPETQEDIVVWTTKPTCEAAGEGYKECTREGCDHQEPVQKEALGHKWQSKEGQMVPGTDGCVDFYTYECANGCGQVSLGFKADQPTEASKDHLVFETNSDGEVGARFWGRPIGNALKLDADGTSVNQQNGEIVYSSQEQGDFFEYKFRLTAAQAATLATCRCYVDAKPANYLNGTDFWAYGASNDEWTPGYYIDGGEGHYQVDAEGQPVMVKDHAPAPKTTNGVKWTQEEIDAAVEGDPAFGKTTNDYKIDPVEAAEGVELETEVKMGKRIEDYRYILYVDGEVCDFDKTITAPTSGSNNNMRRGEFVMPYTFHFKEGVNTISLRMAGGYRSLFYNFYFRQYVEPAAPQA